jgi:hypothetical protein
MWKSSSLFDKCQGISRLAEDLSASQDRLWSMELAYLYIIYLFTYLFIAQNIARRIKER